MVNVGASLIEEMKNSNGNQSLILMKTESFNNIMGYLSKSFGSSGLSIIYSMGHDSGVREVKKIREEMKQLEKPLPKRAIIEMSLQRLSQMGWGKFELKELDQITGNVDISVKKNPFSETCAMNENSGCLFLHGYVSGILTEALEEETMCGNPRCIDLDETSCTFHQVRQPRF
jgi:predicted hydrocarbon binding protein